MTNPEHEHDEPTARQMLMSAMNIQASMAGWALEFQLSLKHIVGLLILQFVVLGFMSLCLILLVLTR